MQAYISRLWQAYTFSLVTRPYFTNFITSGVIISLGDLCAQNLERHYTANGSNWDSGRFLRAFVWGCLTGPVQVFWFRFLDSKIGVAKTVKHAAKKMMINQTVFAPTMNTSYFAFIKATEHYHEGYMRVMEEFVNLMNQSFIKTMMSSFVVFPAVHMINFTLIPVQYRVIWVSGWLVGWNCFLSLVGHDDKVDNKVH